MFKEGGLLQSAVRDNPPQANVRFAGGEQVSAECGPKKSL